MEQFARKRANIFHENFKYLQTFHLWSKQPIIVSIRFVLQNFVVLGCIGHFLTGDRSKGYLSDFVEDCAMIVSGVGMNLTIISFAYKRDDILRLVQEMNRFATFGKPANFDKTRNLLDRLIRFYKYFVLLSILYYGSLGLIKKASCFKNIQETNLVRVCGLLAQSWAPFDIQPWPQNQIVFLAQNLAAILCVCSTGAIYTFIFTITEHAVLRIKHLKYSIREMEHVDGQMEKRLHFRKCVIYHNNVINIVEQINSCFSTILFATISVDTLIMGMLALQFLIENSFHVLLHLMGWVITLFLLSFTGQRLIDESLSVADCIYFLNWYNDSPRLRKDLSLMILRSQKPLALRTGDYGFMSFSTFLGVMKTSYSYIAVLKQTL